MNSDYSNQLLIYLYTVLQKLNTCDKCDITSPIDNIY